MNQKLWREITTGMQGVTSLVIQARMLICVRLLQTIMVTLQRLDSVDIFQEMMVSYIILWITKDVVVGMTNISVSFFISYCIFFANRHVSKCYVFVDVIVNAYLISVYDNGLQKKTYLDNMKARYFGKRPLSKWYNFLAIDGKYLEVVLSTKKVHERLNK